MLYKVAHIEFIKCNFCNHSSMYDITSIEWLQIKCNLDKMR